MSYKTLYRAYRPTTFSDVVGQEHITRTFKNALKNDKISHAYLFTGPRGTGKTTIAKIIAKAVNCELAPTSEPCNKCDSCSSINSGFDSDIFEIDAASNNGVDEIREIRDKVKYAPTVGRFKVYIIDEVHMLSTGAFNALLKTLEEPPSHVIFILATTEPHKIPATIISRCQRFDFKSISVKDIIYRMKYIVTVENIKIEDKAMYAIAKNALGGMRDALSILDQALSYSDGEITEANVHEITGTVSEDHLINIVSALIEHNTKEALKILDDLFSLGKEPLRLIENLIFYFRDLFLMQKMNQIDEQLIVNHSVKSQELAKLFTDVILVKVISILNQTQYEMRRSNLPRVFIELAIFEIDNLLPDNDKKEIISEEITITTEEAPELNKDEDIELNGTTENKYIDVSIIENILNNGSKEKKLNIILQWQSLKDIDVNLANIEQLLLDGEVVAVSQDNKIILAYEYDTICAKLYEKDFYDKACGLLAKLFKEKYEIIALPKKIWNEKRTEFVEQFKQNIKFPKLSPIEEPLIVRKQRDKYEYEPEFVKEAVNLFGEDIVKIK